MKNRQPNNTAEALANRVRFSIVYKLNARLAARLFAIFLTLIILLLAAFAVSLVVYAEKTAHKAALVLKSEGLPPDAQPGWLSLSGCRVLPVNTVSDGFSIPWPLRGFFPDETAGGVRHAEILPPEDAAFFDKFPGAVYHLTVEQQDRFYDIAVDLTPAVSLFQPVFLVLVLIELLELIKNLIKSSRVIRETLSPISELAEAAQNLNLQSGALPVEKMQALAGRLDGINAAKLDTRIPIDETQDELKTLAGAINGMLERINESYRSQVRFVSDASHELRTPISVIQGYANLLDRWGKNDEKALQESIDAIKDEAANMRRLSNSFCSWPAATQYDGPADGAPLICGAGGRGFSGKQ
jgi:HAMP domain-containing protein